jgi:hypothetical protein
VTGFADTVPDTPEYSVAFVVVPARYTVTEGELTAGPEGERTTSWYFSIPANAVVEKTAKR